MPPNPATLFGYKIDLPLDFPGISESCLLKYFWTIINHDLLLTLELN